jgi:hypothetical protein
LEREVEERMHLSYLLNVEEHVEVIQERQEEGD